MLLIKKKKLLLNFIWKECLFVYLFIWTRSVSLRVGCCWLIQIFFQPIFTRISNRANTNKRNKKQQSLGMAVFSLKWKALPLITDHELQRYLRLFWLFSLTYQLWCLLCEKKKNPTSLVLVLLKNQLQVVMRTEEIFYCHHGSFSVAPYWRLTLTLKMTRAAPLVKSVRCVWGSWASEPLKLDWLSVELQRD